MVAPDYAATRAALAKKIGLGRKPGQKLQAKAATNPKPETKPAAKPKAPAKPPAQEKPIAAAKPRKKLGVSFGTAATAPDELPAAAPEVVASEAAVPATE